VLDAARHLEPIGLARVAHACTHTTFSPHVVQGGSKINVVPDRVAIDVDVRALPGVSPLDVDAMLRQALGDLASRVDIEAPRGQEGSRTPLETPLGEAIARVTGALVPGSKIIPRLTGGATDARYFRWKGVPSYGFALHSRRIPAVVTGGSRGIGRAIALRLARDGARCAVTYRRNADAAREVVGAIEALGVEGLAVPLELGEPERVGPALAAVADALGSIDILVASAAATAFRPLLALMQGRGGRIVAISGIDSFQAMDGHGVLGAAKAAVESLVRALAHELGPAGITVNGVNPGFIATDSSRLYVERGLGQPYDAAVARLVAATPVRRVGTVDDVADCVAWIASDGAGFLTGQTIRLDGGLTIVSPMMRLK
jgi:enoyl-[acyl-carrier protein] reductase III